MTEVTNKIKTSGSEELEMLLRAVIKRYSELFPDWEISFVTVPKTDDRNEQLDRVIRFIENMKQ